MPNVLNLIGQTPLVYLDRLAKQHGLKSSRRVRIAAKCEFRNPGGSIKDRPALGIIDRAEAAGELQKGRPVIELTSGNFGTGMAIVCRAKGYPFTAVMSTGNTPERARMMRALGARVELVKQAPGSPPMQVSGKDLELVEKRTLELVKELDAFRADQFRDPGTITAHRHTGEEIWSQSRRKATHFCCSIGSAGSFTGISQFLKTVQPGVQCVALEPATARVLAGKKITNASHVIQGTGYSKVPPAFDKRLADGYAGVTNDEALTVARELAEVEGLFVGISSGANVAGALAMAETAPAGSLIVTLLCDTGLKYLSTNLFP
ncbi:MAG TPA: cysteine synthase family protein [Planctomycetota bacterium]|nr:cysteine synthase family protein [Planctomycetota bacterium]